MQPTRIYPPTQTSLGVRHAFPVGEETRDEPLRTSAWEATSHHSPAHRYGRSEAHSDGRWFHLKAICEPITKMTLLIICQIYVTLGSVTNRSTERFWFSKGMASFLLSL